MSTDGTRTETDVEGVPERRAADANRPFVSVVVPVYNDPDGVRTTLDALVRQSYPAMRHEVIVVDNGSTDRTQAVVQSYAASYDQVTFLVEDEVQGSYAARNRGIRASSGSVIAFVDADMTVGPQWLESIADRMATTRADYMGCDVTLFPPGEDGLVARYNRHNDLHVERFVTEQSFVPTCCLVVRRSLLDQVGTFDPRLTSGGDYEFGNRVAKTGRDLDYCPDVSMYHPTRTSLRALLGKAARVGRGKTQIRRYYPDRYGSPLLHVLNPRAYLPPSRDFLRRSIRGWDDLSTGEKVAFFLLTYVTSLAKAWGQALELARPTDTGAPAD